MVTMDDKTRDVQILLITDTTDKVLCDRLRHWLEIGYYIDLAMKMDDKQIFFVLQRELEDEWKS